MNECDQEIQTACFICVSVKMKCTVVVFVVLTVLHLTVASVFDIFSADRVANKKLANIKRTPINDDLIKRIHNKTSLFKVCFLESIENIDVFMFIGKDLQKIRRPKQRAIETLFGNSS